MPNQGSVIRFVILAVPRSGSNMLCSLLNSHSNILCHHELYNPNGIFYALHLRGTGFQLAGSIRRRDESALKFLSQVWQYHEGTSCVGFKMTHKQNLDVFHTVLTDPRVKKIILKRKNVVKTYVSKLLAENSGAWEDYSEGNPEAKYQVSIDLTQLQYDQSFNQGYYQEIISKLNETKQEYFQINYESLSHINTQQEFLNFLQQEYQPLTTQSRKQNPMDLRLLVSNFNELLQQSSDREFLQQLTALDG